MGGGGRSNRNGVKNENEMENQRYLMRDGINRGYIAQGADLPPCPLSDTTAGRNKSFEQVKKNQLNVKQRSFGDVSSPYNQNC